MKWVLHEGLHYVGGDRDLVRRTYTPPGGKLYPRLTLAVYHLDRGSPSEGVVLECSSKWKSSEWWQKANIPFDLIPDACELFQEALALIKEKETADG